MTTIRLSKTIDDFCYHGPSSKDMIHYSSRQMNATSDTCSQTHSENVENALYFTFQDRNGFAKLDHA